jgi:small-conductance mechanosensitive channel
MIIAKLSDIVFTSILKKMAGKTESSIDDHIIDIIHKPIYYSILFVGLSFSVSLIGLSETIQFIFTGFFKTIIVIIWGSAIFKAFIYIIKWYSNKAGVNSKSQKRLMPLFDNLGKMIIFIAVIYFIFLSWGINVTAFVASAGMVSFVVAFAAKDTLGNLFAGIFIMADSPYKEGDYINLDTGERGYVQSIGIRSTRIMTRDDIEITIPNAVIANSKIINESGGPYEKERVRINISVAYGTDIKKVRQILMDIATSGEDVCKDPDPRVRFREFGDSALLFQLLFWIEKPEMRGRVTDSVNGHIYSRFTEENIEIPFPQRTIHIKKTIDE